MHESKGFKVVDRYDLLLNYYRWGDEEERNYFGTRAAVKHVLLLCWNGPYWTSISLSQEAEKLPSTKMCVLPSPPRCPTYHSYMPLCLVPSSFFLFTPLLTWNSQGDRSSEEKGRGVTNHDNHSIGTFGRSANASALNFVEGCKRIIRFVEKTPASIRSWLWESFH